MAIPDLDLDSPMAIPPTGMDMADIMIHGTRGVVMVVTMAATMVDITVATTVHTGADITMVIIMVIITDIGMQVMAGTILIITENWITGGGMDTQELRDPAMVIPKVLPW